MYSGSSEQYWKQRTKPSHRLKSPRNLLILGCTLFLSAIAVLSKSRSNARIKLEQHEQRLLEESMTRPSATVDNIRTCEIQMRDALRLECDDICRVETKSIPRPTMYNACHHGCSRSFYAAAMIGCREGSEEEALLEINGESHSHTSCSRYIDVNPRPNVQITCKKYYKEGAGRGWKLGNEVINTLLEVAWNKKLKNDS